MKTKHYYIVGLLLIIVLVNAVWVTSWYWKREYRTVLKEQKETLLDSITLSQEKEDKLLIESKNATNNVIKKIKSIDDKLKADEKIIDNRDVTDADIDSLLSRFN